jgi:hypothetical protein
MVDYKELLHKYVRYVYDSEGSDYIEFGSMSHYATDVEFTEEEWGELEKASLVRRNPSEKEKP